MLEIDHLTVRRDGRVTLSLPSLRLGEEGVTAILGHNGSGKSTLMNVLARQLAPDAGTVRLDGADIARPSARAFARRIAYLPQRTPEIPGLTVRDLVGLGRYPWRGALGRWGAGDRDAVDRAMAAVDIAGFADRLAEELSGGERQRAWIAMLLAQEAPVLMLDEPTSALDLPHQLEILRLFRRLADQDGRKVIAILHDLNLAARHADRLLVLQGGRVAYDGAPGPMMTPARLRGIYGIPVDVLDHPSGPVAVPV